ncbi:MAG TPA: IS110 family transposase [Symbiobacteriaceae bacterium]|nr:IS110 family transposase [Symbiobacteriaceae bacterium]
MLRPDQFAFVGTDTHKHQHSLAVCDCWSRVHLQLDFPNDPKSFPGVVEQVKAACPERMKIIFGIEGSGGYGYLFATFLRGMGFVVKEINATLTDRQRRKAPHPEKSDAIDARAIAKVLMDNLEELPEAGSDEVAKAMQELVQQRDVLVHNRVSLRNRLHSLLYQQHPNYRDIFYNTFCPAALAFWERFPSPRHFRGFGVKRMLSWFRRQRHLQITEEKVLEILNAADKKGSSTFLTEQRDFLVRDLVQQLRLLDDQIARLVERMDKLLQQTGQTLTTMDGVDTVLASKILAHVDTTRITTAAKLAKHAGVAPLENSSGMTRRKRRSKHGCRALNHALYCVAVNQIRRNPVAQAYFRRKVAQGKSKTAALRCLMRRLCDVIFALIRDQVPYRQPQPKAA